MTGTATAPIRHLRPRGDGGTQQTTTVERFFDLVYVFAVTQLRTRSSATSPSPASRASPSCSAALWWLYLGATAEHARVAISTSDDPGRLARDAYTYFHLPIVAGIIATAVANHLLIAGPHQAPDGAGAAMILGGAALYLLGASLLDWRITGATNAKRLAVAALLILLVPLGGHVSVLLLSLIVASLLTALAVWELRAPGVEPAARAA